MTEPKELRSIDELFRNTFNNLPDTPAENGWDQPSEQVWAYVQQHAKPPASGWSIQTLLILAGFAVTLVVGIYFAFSGPAVSDTNQEQPINPAVETIAVSPVSVDQKSEPAVSNDIVAAPKSTPVVQTPVVKPVRVDQPAQVEATATQEQRQEVKPLRFTGAAPLPGSNTTQAPNTTEARKAEQAKKLNELWQTPLPLLPVPNAKKQ